MPVLQMGRISTEEGDKALGLCDAAVLFELV